MKIQYNEKEKSLEIDDRLKTHYFALKFLMILNIFTAGINLYTMNGRQFGWIGFVWIFVGILSIVGLIYMWLKKTTLEKIPLEKIIRLKEKKILGMKRFSLELKNGKLRDIIKLNTQSDIMELKKMFADIGIETS